MVDYNTDTDTRIGAVLHCVQGKKLTFLQN